MFCYRSTHLIYYSSIGSVLKHSDHSYADPSHLTHTSDKLRYCRYKKELLQKDVAEYRNRPQFLSQLRTPEA